jgi:hypothetical protein
MPEIKKLDYSHQALADMVLTNPDMSRRELALVFDKSPTWIQYVIHSGAFQVFLEERRKELIDPVIRLTLEDRINTLANLSADVLMEKLSQNPVLVNDNFALRAFESTTKALGYGARDSGNVQVNNNFVVALPGKVENAETWAAGYKGGGFEAGRGVDVVVPPPVQG